MSFEYFLCLFEYNLSFSLYNLIFDNALRLTVLQNSSKSNSWFLWALFSQIQLTSAQSSSLFPQRRKYFVIFLFLETYLQVVLIWIFALTSEPGGLQSMGLRRVGHDSATSLSLFTFIHWRRKWQPTPVFLPGESQGQGSLMGCRLLGRTVGYYWSDLAAAA